MQIASAGERSCLPTGAAVPLGTSLEPGFQPIFGALEAG